jgi:hypothetical protein
MISSRQLIVFIVAFTTISILSGCSSTIKITEFPKPPDILLEEPNGLNEATNSNQLSDLLDTVVENYGICRTNQERLILWQSWYKEQEILYKESRSKFNSPFSIFR